MFHRPKTVRRRLLSVALPGMFVILASWPLCPAMAGNTQAARNAAPSGTMFVYVGTYTRGKSEGIYLLSLEMKTGKLTKLGVTKGIRNPSFLAIAPNRKFLYAVSEVDDSGGGRPQGSPAGAVTAFAIDRKSGALKKLNWQTSGGAGPCHVSVDHAGKTVLVANYGGGSVESLPIEKDGRLGRPGTFIQHTGSSVNPARQKGPHAHSINVDPANRFAFAADLGLDKILIYKLNPDKATLTPNDPAFARVKPGSGPRHFAFHPGGKFAYVINEIASTVTAFAYDAGEGKLTNLQTISTLPKGFPGKRNSTAEVQVHPSGRFLYGSNRGHNSIAIFRINQKTGKLKPIGHESTQGKTPRNFGIDPTGRFLLAANQQTNNIVVFRIDAKTGRLKPTGHSLEVPIPVCVKFLQP